MTSASEATAPRAARGLIFICAFAALALALGYGFYFVFSRSMSLDEGYLMITVQGFNSGHALYDSVFTQYGPLYYFYEWLLRGALSIPMTHDATRLLCLAHWTSAAVLLGLAGWRITRSSLAATFVALLAFTHLATVANEPGHPQELVVQLLAMGALVAAGEKNGRWTLPILALITALLFFTKINVGIFFGFALMLVLRCHSEDRFTGGFWNWLLLGLSAGIPWLLTRQHLDAEWCRNFAAVVTCTTVATLLVAQRVSVQRTVGFKNYASAGAAFLITAAVLLGLTLLTGTSWHGLIDGLLLTPLKMPRVALLPVDVPYPAVFSAVASVAIAAVVLWKRGNTRVDSLLSVLKMIFAICGAFVLIGDAKNQLVWLLPWVWLVAVQPKREDEQLVRRSFARVFLCLVTAWQALQAYPIAGTQLTLATFLLILAFGICLNDALIKTATLPQLRQQLAGLPPGVRTLAPVPASVALLCLFANHWCPLSSVRHEYARLRSLDLPGSRLVRMDEEAVTMYRQLVGYLTTESDTFVAYPGINSLYFWTGQRPPTQLNSTGWGQLSHSQQQEILEALRKGRRPRLVVVEAMMESWATPYAEPVRPLVRYVAEDCRPVQRIGRFIIFEPKAKTESVASR